MFTMFRRVAQKTLVHAQREHMQSEEMIASKYLGQIHMNKTLERQKSLCYGVKHTMRLEEKGQAEQNEAKKMRWEKRMQKYVNQSNRKEKEEKEKRDERIGEYRERKRMTKLKKSESTPVF